MSNETQEQVKASTEAQTNEGGAEQQTADYKAQFEALKTEYDAFKGNAEQWKTASDNAINYFKADPVGASRVQKWLNGEAFEAEQATQKPTEEKAGKFDPRAYEQEVLSKAERMFYERSAPMRDFQAQMEAKENKESILTSYPWANEKTYEDFSNKFESLIQTNARSIANKYNVSPNKAEEMAIQEFVGYDHDTLFMKIMKDEILENAAKGMRGSSVLPKGMNGRLGNAAGPEPGLMEKARKAYADAQNKHPDEVANVITSYAKQLEMKSAELYHQLLTEE